MMEFWGKENLNAPILFLGETSNSNKKNQETVVPNQTFALISNCTGLPGTTAAAAAPGPSPD